MDSLVTTAIAAKESDELYLLHFSYGQLTHTKEQWCFSRLAEHYRATAAKIVNYQWLAEIGGSALTDSRLKLEEHKPVPNTYVPFRNATMLCGAVAWAEVIGASKIYIGAVEEDGSGYPDCRESFFAAMRELIKHGTVNASISIETPVLHLNKARIVECGIELGVPFHYSWSCYFAENEACGDCPSCRLRLRAFAAAGIHDPIQYKGH